ncbi:MAG: hypothetical protein BAJALOKI1v1_150020 [Promethearchaeota archaeon]|nr:MAG: hypothetical protein BAJALOKI1v1_150020 [Candidatus Lokiarchaeota archaeon]
MSYDNVIINNERIRDFKEKNIKQINTRVKPESLPGKIIDKSSLNATVKEYVKYKDQSYIMLVHTVHNVYFDKINLNTDLDEVVSTLELKYVEQIRFFSEFSELFIWKQDNSIYFRFREDEEDNSTKKDSEGYLSRDYYEEFHIMWGTQLKEGNTLLEEERGIKLEIPYTLKEDAPPPLRFVVRNYIDYDKKDGFLEFFDARLVKIIKRDGSDISNS